MGLTVCLRLDHYAPDLARERLEEKLRHQSEDFEALVLLGQVSWDQNRKEDSLTLFLKAAKVRKLGYCWGRSFGSRTIMRTASTSSSRQPR